MSNELENLDRPEAYLETSKTETESNDPSNDSTHSKEKRKKPLYKNPWIIGGGITIVALLIMLTLSANKTQTPASNNTNDNQPVKMVPSFGGAQETKDIETQLAQSSNDNYQKQQNQIKDLEGQISDLQGQVKDKDSQETQSLKSQLAKMQEALSQKNTNTNNSSINSSVATLNQKAWVGPHPAEAISGGAATSASIPSSTETSPMQDFNLNFSSNQTSTDTAYNAYVPAGTFVQAVLLGGADANAAVGSQGNTTPILFRLLDNGTEPNLKKSHLKNCFVTGQTYGDISSDRAMVRLDRLSCNYSDGTILDIPVYGTAYDIGGKNGVRGKEVLHNGKILAMSGVSGFLQGFANAFQNIQTTQTANLVGTTSTTVAPSSSLSYAAYGGAASAMNNLSNYYIQLAEQYHPIIQINAGAKVDLIFTKGFSTDPTQTNVKPKETATGGETNPYGFASPPQTQSWQVPTSSTNLEQYQQKSGE